MWNNIPEDETKASELRGSEEFGVTIVGSTWSSSFGSSKHFHGRWMALSLVFGVVAAAVVVTSVSRGSCFIVDSADIVVKAESAAEPEQKIDNDVYRDVERHVDKDVGNWAGQVKKDFNKITQSNISDPAKKQKLIEKVKQDMRRDLDRVVEADIKKIANGNAEQDANRKKIKQDMRRDFDKVIETDIKKVADGNAQQDANREKIKQNMRQDLEKENETDIKKDDPVLKNYLASPRIGTPSTQPEMVKQLAPLWPSMFCWCIMQTAGQNQFGWVEETLIKQQMERGIGIFSCNAFSVMTDETLALNRWGPKGFPKIPKDVDSTFDTPTWAIGSTQVSKGAMTNPLNAVPFKTAWEALQQSQKIEKHDWVVKVDPDTVWFPVRLRVHLKTYMPGHGNGWDNVFLKNCPRFNSLQGPIEVISNKGATNLENNIQKCGGIWGTGEDHFIVNCLQQLGVPPQMEPGLLNDKYCDGYGDCTNSWKVAFHPYKNPAQFMECFNKSKEAEHPSK